MTNLRVTVESVIRDLRKLAKDPSYMEPLNFPLVAIADRLQEALQDELPAPRTDHAENLAKALEHYLNAHDTLSGVQSSDEATGQSDASEGGFVDAANDTWRAMRTALHEYRKHSSENRSPSHE